ncbi:hypothetical protein FVR03_04885 [Pontibacter qinzhouensis]|uniref:GIY-YIG nuclease family protein n=1 Tax=Pontibacter qinzhouensis TaxID=2603253 RepID=A0A5C8KAQ5_9BACT|nr:hypothetical protein [Pontibacter qinzhouensis]TXK50521.1 hypothetical protein FVR03_04885 [Pontibacter qinzhouensis]
MIISSKENKLNETTQKAGTYVYALYLDGKVVHVGQCTDIRHMAMSKITGNEMQFERITYTFMDGVHPYSKEANLMESVAHKMLVPSIEKALA